METTSCGRSSGVLRGLTITPTRHGEGTRCTPAWVFVALLALGLLVAAAAFAENAGKVTLTHHLAQVDAALNDGAVASESLSESSLMEIDFAAATAEIYGRFAELSQSSGDDIRFAISEVTTYSRSRFGELLWRDLFTFPSGTVIETIPHERLGRLPSESVVNYRSEWRELDPESFLPSEFLKESPGLRADEAVRRLTAAEPARFSQTGALSTYQVEVTLQGRSRSYQALILWRQLAPRTLLFSMADHVVNYVDMAFHEDREVRGREAFDSKMAPAVEDFLPTKAECISTSLVQDGPPLSLTDRVGHVGFLLSGSHSSSVRFKFTCTSQSNCFTTCQPGERNPFTCQDQGNTGDLIHRVRQSSLKIDTINGNSTKQAQCGIARGCGIQGCNLGICFTSVSFGVEGKGASLEVKASPNAISDMSISNGHFCEILIRPVPDVPDCAVTTNNFTVLDLSGSKGVFELPSRDFTLSRVEDGEVVHHGKRLRLLMADWAVVSYEAGASKSAAVLQTSATSSPAFARIPARAVAQELASGSVSKDFSVGRQEALVIALPPHENNDRYIPMPKLRVSGDPVPSGAGRGRVLVRADFAEDHTLQGLDFLHTTTGGVSRELALHVERALSLERVGEGDHRVVAFVLLEVGEALGVVSRVQYLPKCCTGDGDGGGCSPDQPFC